MIKINEEEKLRRSIFGEKLRNAREKKGLKQSQMARFLSVSPTSYTNYEKGEREPSLKNLIKISELLDVSIDSLLINKPTSELEEAKKIWIKHGFKLKEEQDFMIIEYLNETDRNKLQKEINYSTKKINKKVKILKQDFTKITKRIYNFIQKGAYDNFKNTMNELIAPPILEDKNGIIIQNGISEIFSEYK